MSTSTSEKLAVVEVAPDTFVALEDAGTDPYLDTLLIEILAAHPSTLDFLPWSGGAMASRCRGVGWKLLPASTWISTTSTPRARRMLR